MEQNSIYLNFFWEQVDRWLVNDQVLCPDLKTLKKYLKKVVKQKTKYQSENAFLEQLYEDFKKVESCYLHPEMLFESSLMIVCQERQDCFWKELSVIEEKEKKVQKKKDKLKKIPKDESITDRILLKQDKTKISKLKNTLAAEMKLLSLEKIRKTEKYPSGEMILRYKRIVSQDKKFHKKREVYLRKLGVFIVKLLEEHKRIIGMPNRFIRLESYWNEHLLGILYQQLVDKGYIEGGRQDFFISVFLGYEEEFANSFSPIKWMKITTTGKKTENETNLSALGYLLVGLKKLSQLRGFIIFSEKIEELTQEKRNSESKITKDDLTKTQKNKLSIKKKIELTKESINADTLRKELQQRREKILAKTYFSMEDKKVIEKYFVKYDGSPFSSDKLRIKESYKVALEVYMILRTIKDGSKNIKQDKLS